MAEKEPGSKFGRGMRKPLWAALGLALLVCIVAVWVGAQWRPQPVAVERALPADGFSY